ncbi:hypothetical protein EIN_044240 [Entamoeba invadens IP1]|uniref:Uncharacterized protein n=1 Tax=Entamoeba invadens IP1 TaxID=370355 RepID=A0A0A1U549_ENTIV|nr:hypothetical protein EIN_044240 [Entamoeba invadens IP1]ELP86866.1 hypothetical protein EIN_044240 [Entamoeba invadens IP1]|eukprot:XP_004253637.1 hypothetical protein EIN_044240 [Entamoeba invadens IP1]
MGRLEKVYLMNVALFLHNRHTLEFFLCVSKSCCEAFKMLHINPTFNGKMVKGDVSFFMKMLPKLETLEAPFECYNSTVQNFRSLTYSETCPKQTHNIKFAKIQINTTSVDVIDKFPDIREAYFMFNIYTDPIPFINRIITLKLDKVRLEGIEGKMYTSLNTLLSTLKSKTKWIIVYKNNIPITTDEPIKGNVVNCSETQFGYNLIFLARRISSVFDDNLYRKYLVPTVKFEKNEKVPNSVLLFSCAIELNKMETDNIFQTISGFSFLTEVEVKNSTIKNFVFPETLTKLRIIFSQSTNITIPKNLKSLYVFGGTIQIANTKTFAQLEELKLVGDAINVTAFEWDANCSVSTFDVEYNNNPGINIPPFATEVCLLNCDGVAQITVPKSVFKLTIGYCANLKNINYQNKENVRESLIVSSPDFPEPVAKSVSDGSKCVVV